MKASITSVSKTIEKRLDQMIKQASQTRAFLERVVYREYIKAQRKRWMTEGATDGWGPLQKWTALNTKYAAWKRRRYAAAPGGGRKMLIATQRLFLAVVGEGDGHKKLISDRSIVIGVDIPYAKYVNSSRPFFIFSDEMMNGLKDKHKKFITARGVS